MNFMLILPYYFVDQLAPKYEIRTPAELLKIAAKMPDKVRLVAVLKGMNLEGDELQKTVAVPLPALPEGSTATGDAAGLQRLSAAGLMVMAMGDQAQISAVRFGSQARREGWEQGWDVAAVKVPNAARP